MSEGQQSEDLLARVAERDVAALSELYDRYAPRVCGLIAQIIPSGDAADEILQKVFLRLWTESASLSPDGGSVAAWLVVTARAAAVERLRALRKDALGVVPPAPGKSNPASAAATRNLKPAGLATSPARLHRSKVQAAKTPPANAPILSVRSSLHPAWLPQPKEISLIDDRLVLLHKAINQLPKTQRQALELAVFGGLTESEIAAEMGEPLGKAQRSLRAAVTFIKHRRRAVCGTWAANI
jgi:RNA polymerase sigma-70 factor (ECF subfamily)